MGENREFFFQVDYSQTWYHSIDLDELIRFMYDIVGNRYEIKKLLSLKVNMCQTLNPYKIFFHFL
jgi:hypothetical protein